MSNIGVHQDNINTMMIKEMYDILQESKEDLSTIKYHYVKPVINDMHCMYITIII